MKHLFLTSSIGTPGVSSKIRSSLGHTRILKTAFITTPVEVEDMTDDGWYQDDRKALTEEGFEFFDYTITNKSESDIKTDLAGVEAIYISGGNEFWLKHQANKNNFGNFIKEFVNNGGIYLGTSAGSIIMSPDMSPCLQITDESACPEKIVDLSGFGIVDFLVMPHWGSDNFKSVYMNGRMEHSFSEKWKIILLNNSEYVEVLGDRYRIVDVAREDV